MQFKYLIMEDVTPEIKLLKLNRPDCLNALSDEVFNELLEAFTLVENTPGCRVLIITGCGRAFAAGADIINMKDKSSLEIKGMVYNSLVALRKLENMPVISIAAVNGYALGGGCEVAMTCDMRIASEDAQMGLPETGLGIIPGSGGTQRLPRLVGAAKAKELILSGKIIDAQEALQIGLVNRVTSRDELMDETIKLAKQIIKKAPIAVRCAKESIDKGLQVDIDTGLRYEMNLFTQLFATKDQKEGMTAFAEKRKPQFKDE